MELIKTKSMSTDDIFKSYDPMLIDKEDCIRKLNEKEVHVVCSSETSGDNSSVSRDPVTRQAGMINVFGTYEFMFSDMNVSE